VDFMQFQDGQFIYALPWDDFAILRTSIKPTSHPRTSTEMWEASMHFHENTTILEALE